eukprot:gene4936-6153_t
MGGDIHLCALILGNKRIILLYIFNLIGSSLSSISTLFTILNYIYGRYKRGKTKPKIDQFCLNSSNNNQINYSNNNNPSNLVPNQDSITPSEDDPLLKSSPQLNSSLPSSPTTSSISTASSTTTVEISTSTLLFQCKKGKHNDSCRENFKQILEQTTTERKPKKINSLIFWLSISDFIGCTFIIISQVFLITKIEFAQSLGFCISMRCIIHFGFLASFLWTNCIAFYLLREVYEWKPYDFPIVIFHLICWGISFFSVSTFFFGNIIQKNPNTGWCSIDPSYQLYFWVFPLLLSILWNLLCYILIYHKFKQILSYGIYGSRSQELKRYIARKLTFYLVAFIVCWAPDLINHSVFFINKSCPPFWMWLLQDFFSPAQGFLNCMVYALTNNMLPSLESLKSSKCCQCIFNTKQKHQSNTYYI